MLAPFSLWWFIFLFLVVGGLLLCRRLFRNRSRRAKCLFIAAVSLFTLVYWILYKVALSMDPEFEFIFWAELPLHLCNVCMILAAIAAWKDIRILQGVCYFGCSIGAVLAVLTPSEGFSPAVLLSAKGLGYWGFHFLVLFICLAFVVLEVYQPRWIDVPLSCAALYGITVPIFLINLLLRATVYPEANYFYTYGLPGNPISEMFYDLIPVPLLCGIPFILLFMAVDVLLILPTCPWKRQKKLPERESVYQ